MHWCVEKYSPLIATVKDVVIIGQFSTFKIPTFLSQPTTAVIFKTEEKFLSSIIYPIPDQP